MRTVNTKFVTSVLFAALALMPRMAFADITYDLTLTPTSGPEGGTGFFTINTPFPSTGLDSYTPGGATFDLLALSFTIDGSTFDLSKSSGTPQVNSLNGVLFDILYNGAITSGGKDLALTTNTSYVFSDILNSSVDTSGTFTATPETSAVPEPMSIILFGTVLVGLTVFLRKRLFGRSS